MKKYLILGILLVIFIAGCTGRQVKQAPDRGVTIDSFTPSDVQVMSGDPVLFDLQIENIGGTTASHVQADLYGVQSKWSDTFGNTVQDTQTKQIRTLSPPLPERNIPGDFDMKQWQLNAPDTPQGVRTSYPVTARVSYDYNTSGFFRIGAVSEGEYKRMQALGQTSEFVTTVTNSQGPIQLAVDPKFEQVIRVDTTTADPDVRAFRFDFSNVGDGFPVTPNDAGLVVGMGGKIRGTIEVRGPGVTFDDCLGVTGGTIINLDNSEITPQLRANGKFPVSCSIKIDKSVWGNRPKDTVEFVFNIFYRYYVDSTLSVNVVGGKQ